MQTQAIQRILDSANDQKNDGAAFVLHITTVSDAEFCDLVVEGFLPGFSLLECRTKNCNKLIYFDSNMIQSIAVEFT